MLSLSPARKRSFRIHALASALALATGFACSAATVDRGQVMLVLQTDMSLPKDVDRVRIQVFENGTVKFDNSYPVGPDGAKIPATLGVVGNNENETIEVRVLGFRGSEARTLNKVITTIPKERIAMLRMPIQWLCEGEVTEFDEDTYETTCDPIDGEETSCVAGRCEKIKIDSRDLEDYAPEEVFGGGNGRTIDGKCFPTETCMGDEGFDVEPNLEDCTVDVPAGKDEPLNFAVKTGADGAGICKGADCFVPLDKNDDFGWKEDDRGDAEMRKVAIPPAVCDRLKDGRATGVRANKTCDVKTAEIPTCGPWSSVGNGPISGGLDAGVPPGMSTCPGFIPGTDLGAITGNAEVDAFLQAAADLKAQAEELKNMAGVTCNNMLSTLGSPGALSNPPLDQEVMDLCTSLGNVLQAQGVPYTVRPGYCTSDTEGQLDCEADCGCQSDLPFEERCETLAGTCDGTCYGDCMSDGSRIACTGACNGICVGTCNGECSNEDADGCNGACNGTCDGTCDGICSGGTTCDGICIGSSASCEGTFDMPSCESPLEPSGCADATCENLCAANAGIGVTCSLSVASVAPNVASDNPDAASAVTMGMGPLTDVLARGEVLLVAASYVANLESVLLDLDPTDPGWGCIAAGAQAMSEASASISAAMTGAVSALGSQGNGSGGPLDAGVDPPNPYGCFEGSGQNPLIDDFEDMNLSIPPNDGRSGTWGFIDDGTGAFEISGISPLVPARGASYYGIRAAGNFSGWGGVTLNLNASCYDASSWQGLALWTYSQTPGTARVRIVTMDALAGCTPTQGGTCAFQATVDIGDTWQQHHLLWGDFSEFDGDSSISLNPANIYRIEVLQDASNVDFTIDDVGFEGAPSP